MTEKDRLYNYLRGWRHGAGMHALDPKFQENADYQDGAMHGIKARREAIEEAQRQYGVKLDILRANESTT